MAEEVVLMKGNEAIAHAAIRCGADGYFGYPITPQSEVLETLAELKPWEMMVKIREAYVIIHSRLVEFYYLYFTLED